MAKRTHTQERYRQRTSQTEKFAEKMEEHSSRRFAELPSRASDHTNHPEGGSYISRGRLYSCSTDFVLLTSSRMDP